MIPLNAIHSYTAFLFHCDPTDINVDVSHSTWFLLFIGITNISAVLLAVENEIPGFYINPEPFEELGTLFYLL